MSKKTCDLADSWNKFTPKISKNIKIPKITVAFLYITQFFI